MLISVNPFRNLGISGEEYVETYRGHIAHELPPHIFALAEAAYRSMKDYHENQCVIIRYLFHFFLIGQPTHIV